jgi:uncharacterized protein YbaR (Trm112 family)
VKIELLELLRCPKTGQALRSERNNGDTQEIHEGTLISTDGHERYQIYNGIPRFVP